MQSDAMKEKEARRIANSVQKVWFVENASGKWEIEFSVSYQEEKEQLTSYYGDEVRS